jgi:hypothetical protein
MEKSRRVGGWIENWVEKGIEHGGVDVEIAGESRRVGAMSKERVSVSRLERRWRNHRFPPRPWRPLRLTPISSPTPLVRKSGVSN